MQATLDGHLEIIDTPTTFGIYGCIPIVGEVD